MEIDHLSWTGVISKYGLVATSLLLAYLLALSFIGILFIRFIVIGSSQSYLAFPDYIIALDWAYIGPICLIKG